MNERAFLSFSISPDELFMVTHFSHLLKNRGVSVTTNYEAGPTNNIFAIKGSQIFIGLILKNGGNTQGVFADYNKAINHGIPALLVVEKGVRLFSGNDEIRPHVVFDRTNPDKAVSVIQDHINQASSFFQRTGNQSLANSNNAWAWFLGGVGLIGLIGMIANATDDEPTPRSRPRYKKKAAKKRKR